ncbi:helix-turn-helix domain-containing protein [Pelagibacterium halotolerans]|uniref:helix-turn-helix domain-containing protein n=1 Tax=Pelagibacterium halotolerans TaxID=531813 RepID=UPI000A03AB53|nr:helix-turn-helix domain-containing protein [Pelagibacterium halotolerans]QJR19126.1 helix-turn-helix domain-containing protein [Pelagibacterium halotolerans]
MDNLKNEILDGAGAIAEFLSLPKRTIYHFAENGTIPTFRLGSKIMARRSTLLAWLEAQEHAASNRVEREAA